MITIVVPAYNEEKVIGDLIKEVKKVKLKHELLIINDGSTDKTAEIIKKHKKVRLISHKRNFGLGAALKTGFKEAKGEFIVTMDADLTHPIALIPVLINNLKHSDVCIASRYIKGGGMKNVPTWRVIISKVANIFFSFIYGIKAKDVTSGFKAYKAEKIKDIEIKRRDFAAQLEIMAKLARKRAKFSEVPIILGVRKKGASKFKPIMYLKYLSVLKDLI
jgi:dolichol-phosphate mannosyltransferase